MLNVPTPHIAAKRGEIASTVLMPGDPLRAKFIAEKYLSNVACINSIRNMLGFTGKYNGKLVSVMASGMGMPSMGIYSHELINGYGVENIIRIGTCGALSENLKLRDVVFGVAASTNSNFAEQFKLNGTFAPSASTKLLLAAIKAADENNIKYTAGNILSADTFYNDDFKDLTDWSKMGILAVEMEAAALYMNAARYNANALAIMTVSDHIITGELSTPEEREKSYEDMMKIGLEMA